MCEHSHEEITAPRSIIYRAHEPLNSTTCSEKGIPANKLQHEKGRRRQAFLHTYRRAAIDDSKSDTLTITTTSRRRRQERVARRGVLPRAMEFIPKITTSVTINIALIYDYYKCVEIHKTLS